jgi:DHA2 family multidrug resistance protein
VGIAAFFAPLISVAQGSLPPAQMAFGAGLINFLRITAGSFGASLVTTFWDRRAALHHSQLAEHIGVFAPQASQATAQLGQSGLTASQGLAQINQVVTNQASALAANDIFWISGWLFPLLIASVWLTRKPFGNAPAGGH